jgi:hypothetical protein
MDKVSRHAQSIATWHVDQLNEILLPGHFVNGNCRSSFRQTLHHALRHTKRARHDAGVGRPWLVNA